MTKIKESEEILIENESNEAKRKYVEQYASALVAASYLRIAVFSLSLVCVGLIVLNVMTYQMFKSFKPLIIRINDVGRAEAVSYQNLEYKPQEKELKYFLVQFVTSHYSRMVATVRENFTRSLYFLDTQLASGLIETEKKSKNIEGFLRDSSDEVEVNVLNVVIEDMRSLPYKAAVDFERVYFRRFDHVERRREKYVGHFVFAVRDQVPNALIPINPLGLTITYLREDQAF